MNWSLLGMSATLTIVPSMLILKSTTSYGELAIKYYPIESVIAVGWNPDLSDFYDI